MTATASTSEGQETYFLGSIYCDETEPAWPVNLEIGGKQIRFKIDSGADTTVMAEGTYRTLLQRPKLQETSSKLKSPGGRLECLGQFRASTFLNGNTYTFKTHVVRGKEVNNLLGPGVATTMGLIKRGHIDETTTEDIDVIDSEVFGDIGLLKGPPVSIKLRDGAEPYSIMTPRGIPFPILPKVEVELQRMKAEGIIEEITEPTKWC